jgi:hypothetical protein
MEQVEQFVHDMQHFICRQTVLEHHFWLEANVPVKFNHFGKLWKKLMLS